MAEVTFDNVRIPIKKVAELLGMDCQTVRLMIQNDVVDWGICFKNPGSQNYTYLIYAKKFYEATGYLYQGGVSE